MHYICHKFKAETMLTKFAVKNYRGFENRIELDLSSPSNYEFNRYVIKDNVVKNGIIYGPNGSGKTNFGLAIFDIEYHLAPLKAKKPDYYNNFVYAGAVDQPVVFEYTFKFGTQVVEYIYSKKGYGMLVSEMLRVDGEEIFNRDNNSLKINGKYFPNENHITENLKNSANNISVLNFLSNYYPLDADNYILKLQEFANKMLWFRCLDVREFIGVETQENGNIEEYIISNNLVKDFAGFLADISRQKFDFVQPQKGDKQLWYKIGNNAVPFNQTVSTGTRSLELLFFWMKRMNDAKFVFIDEFDAFYHFDLAFRLCKYMFNLDCQLFLSSHNTYLMTNELLRPDCNFILNKNSIKPLNGCTDKELRFGHNMEKIYRAGAFYDE